MLFKSYINLIVVKSDPARALPTHREERYFDWREGALNSDLLQRHLTNYAELDSGVDYKPGVKKIALVRYTRSQLQENVKLLVGKAGTKSPIFPVSNLPEQGDGKELVAEGGEFKAMWDKVYKFLAEVEKPALLFGFDIIPFDLRLLFMEMKLAKVTNFIPEHVYFSDSFLACMAVEKQHQYEVGPKGKWQDYVGKMAGKVSEGVLVRLQKYFTTANSGHRELVPDMSHKYFADKENFKVSKIYADFFPGEKFVDRTDSVATYAREEKRITACYGTEFVDYVENCCASFQPVLVEIFEME